LTDKASLEQAKQTALDMAEGVRMDRAKAAKKIPEVFTINENLMTNVKEVTGKGWDIADDSSLPKKLVDSPEVKSYVGQHLMQRVLCNFGGTYKKTWTCIDAGTHASPLLPKQGKEETEQFFGQFAPPSVDIGSVNQQFKTTSWLFGMNPHYTNTSTAASAAGTLRLQAMGESHIILVRTTDLSKAVKAVDQVDMKATEANAMFQDMTADKMVAYKAAGLHPYCTCLQVNQMLWIPSGWIIAERAGAIQLHYGIRKSFFENTSQARLEIAAVVEASKAEGKAPVRMEQVLKLYKV
jgi:hypothetical protein